MRRTREVRHQRVPFSPATSTPDLFQNIPEELAPMVVEKYLGRTDDPVAKKDLFLDLLGDAVFVFPCVTVARHHRGEPQRLDRKQHQPRCRPSCPPLRIDTCVETARGWAS